MANNVEKINILGVDVAKVRRREFLRIAADYLDQTERQYFIVTPNPEIILKATADEEFFYILQKADLALADGTGLFFAALIQGHFLRRIPGSDATLDILKIAQKNKYKVAVIKDDTSLSSAEEIDKALQNKFPGLPVLILTVSNENQNPTPTPNQLDVLNEFQPRIVFAAFGAPAQEKFIYHNLKKIPSARLAIGIGGSFDFLTGKIRRAPKLFRRFGVEWLWRLALEPKRRIRRIFNAVVVFPSKVMIFYFLRPFQYRPNVACLLYRKEVDSVKILIVERMKEAGHWQIPQGGTDGENLRDAGARELREELGTDKFVIKKTYKNVYSYEFGQRDGETQKVSGRFSNFKGQRQGLIIAEFTGTDDDIRINFWDHQSWRWVDKKELMGELHVIRRKGAERFLEKLTEYLKENN